MTVENEFEFLASDPAMLVELPELIGDRPPAWPVVVWIVFLLTAGAADLRPGRTNRK